MNLVYLLLLFVDEFGLLVVSVLIVLSLLGVVVYFVQVVVVV